MLTETLDSELSTKGHGGPAVRDPPAATRKRNSWAPGSGMAGGARGFGGGHRLPGSTSTEPMSLQNLGRRSNGDVSCPKAEHTFNRLLFNQSQCMPTALSPVAGKVGPGKQLEIS